jgi:hypothetical protein
MISAFLILASVASPALAQFSFVGPGSTVQGDYLRGVGVAAFGMGVYNRETATAYSIATDTDIRLNEYIFDSLMNENRMNAEHRAAMVQKNKEAYDKLQKRIRDNPEARDVTGGAALNQILEQLNSPKIQESSARSVMVPLSVDEVKRIPFKLGEKGVTRFSIARLTAKGSGKWPIAFQDHQFDRARHDFEHALADVLEQQYKGAVQKQVIESLKKTVDNLEDKLNQVFGPSTDKRYLEAKNRLKEMRATVEMFKYLAIEKALSDLDTYAGTTVNDLRVFMHKHKLQFADAEDPDERQLFPSLYTKLDEQRNKVSVGLAVQDDEPKN